MSGFRLAHGGRIDRATPLDFSFDGQALRGFAGDTLGSALLANGIDVVGRSFKYHRPRGLLGAGLDDPNAIVQLEDGPYSIPNVKASALELYDGLKARAVNSWPSAARDLLAVNAFATRFLPVGFYYKTFMWPHWQHYEAAIRMLAGLGVSPGEPDADIYDMRHGACDVLIVGGGPAGLMAALAAARSGARIVVAESDPEWGGILLSEQERVDNRAGAEWAAEVVAELTDLPNVTLLRRTMAFGYYDHNLIGLVQRLTDHVPLVERSGPRQRLWKLRARRVILATGAIERPLAFPNNDRPGVMLAGAAQRYVQRYAAALGRRAVIAGTNDSIYRCARLLRAAGIEIAAIADARALTPAAKDAAVEGFEVLAGAGPTNVSGRRGVTAVEFHALDERGGAVPGMGRQIACDALLMSGGWSPAVHLFSQSGGRVRFDSGAQAFIPAHSVQDEISIGGCAGTYGLAAIFAQAHAAGCAAAEAAGYDVPSFEIPETDGSRPGPSRALWQIDVAPLGRKGVKAWVDFQNDVTAGDVELAVREGYRSVEHLKRYTTLGMASDQGKTSNVNAIGILERRLEMPMEAIGTTKFRPPYDPVTIGVFAGRRVGENLVPVRVLPANASHARLGAIFSEYGGWCRPACYPRSGESEEAAIRREARNVRSHGGLFDASPLGKIEVFGPDAATFLNRVYVNNMVSLKPGACRYGLMLTEVGIVLDDGVLACLAKGHYIVGTTSGHAGLIAERLQEWLQCEWPDFNVVTTDITSGWAVVNVSGPNARALLQTLDGDIDLSAAAFPHMRAREGRLAGAPCRIQRVSFTGELSYEVSVPSSYGAALWDLLVARGSTFAMVPFGIESLMTLRIEKGFVHLGSDTDGTTQPQDIGFGTIAAKKQGDFIGRRSLDLPEALRPDRRQFVGLETLDGDPPLPVGGQVLPPGVRPPARTQGWVTSSAWSPNLERPVALAMIERGRIRIGEEVAVWDFGDVRRAYIASSRAFDPEGTRLDG